MHVRPHILIIDAQEARRSAFLEIIASDPALNGVSGAATTDNALEQLQELAPDVLIVSLDSIHEGLVNSLLDFFQQAARPILLITATCDLRSALELIKGGISDILEGTPKSLTTEMVATSVRKALDAFRVEQHEKILARTVMCISDCICITDPKNHIVAVNDSFCQTYGYDHDQVVGQDLDGLLPQMNTAEGQTHGEESPEILHPRHNGGSFPAMVSWSEVRTPGGQLLSKVAVIRDISRQKNTEEKLKSSLKEKEVLLKEIHHRVKNNLQVISSLLNLQASFMEDQRVSDALRDSQNRVKSMALIHELLYRSGALNKIDFLEYIRGLVSHVSGSFRNRGDIFIEINIADVEFDVDFAIPCGLIVNELLSNSMKHAFPQGSQGKILIELRREVQDDQEVMILTVSDNGVGLPDDVDVENSRSLGLQLIKMLTQQIKGQLFTQTDDGVQFVITFPA